MQGERPLVRGEGLLAGESAGQKEEGAKPEGQPRPTADLHIRSTFLCLFLHPPQYRQLDIYRVL